MDRRGFLKFAGLVPLGLLVRPAIGGASPVETRQFPAGEKEVRRRLAEIERRVGTGVDGNSAWCPENGKPYKTIAWSKIGEHIKPEGQPAAVFVTPDAAWVAWFAAFSIYRSTHKGKIHWRCRPELHEWPEGYLVYSRLVADD